MSYSRTRGEIVASGGYYVGAKGTETLVINSAGQTVSGTLKTLQTTFLTSSAAQTLYAISPVAGNVTAVYVCTDTASVAAAYTIKHGSAGNTLASGTNTTGVAGLVSTLTLGTVAVTAGESISIARAAQGTAATSVVNIVIQRTS